MIFGIHGSCRKYELLNMSVEDTEDKDSIFIVKVPNSKLNPGRNYIVANNTHDVDYLPLYMKYIALRSKICTRNASVKLLAITHSKSTKRTQPNLYIGQCLRRTSDTLLVDGSGDITQLKRQASRLEKCNSCRRLYWRVPRKRNWHIKKDFGTNFTCCQRNSNCKQLQHRSFSTDFIRIKSYHSKLWKLHQHCK